jgi:hypothetical protein
LVRKLCLSLLVFALAAPGAARAASASLRAAALPAVRAGAERTRPFELVGIHWRGSGQVRFSTHAVGGGWSAWHLAAPEADDLPDPRSAESAATAGWQLGSPFWTGPADGIRYRLSGEVAAVKAFFVRSTPTGTHLRTLQIAGSPQIITRAGWNADEEIRRAAPKYADAVHFAIVHHTAGSNDYTAAQSPAIVKAIELYHVQGNGWNDIGYNFLVDKYGQIFEGRYGGMTRAVIGAHAEGFNTGSVGIALIGNYGTAKVTPVEEKALEELLAWRLDLAHVDPLSTVTAISGGNPKYKAGTAVKLRAISGHRDVYPTSCPGQDLYDRLPAIAQAVAVLGLPKIYAPHASGKLGGPVRFTGKLSSSLPWTVTITDAAKTVVATGTGTGPAIDWTWDASAVTSGTYRWTIATTGARAATGTLTGKGATTGGGGSSGGGATSTATVSALTALPQIVSPNGDGVDDDLSVSYTLSASAPVTVTVLSGSTLVATVFSGTQSAGAQHVTWIPPPEVTDGTYSVFVTAPKTTLSLSFVIDRTLSDLALTPALFSPNGDKRFDTTTIGYSLDQAATVDVRIQQHPLGALVADLGTQTLQAGPQQLSWDGTVDGQRVPDGTYDVVVSATDPLTTVLESLELTVDTAPPAITMQSFAKLRFTISEAANVMAIVNGKRIPLVVQAGTFTIPVTFKPRTVVLIATDAAGNRSRFTHRA